MRHRPARRLRLLGRRAARPSGHHPPRPAGLGGVRQRHPRPLPRLQRHLPLQGAGAPERQHPRRRSPSPRPTAPSGREIITAIVLAYEMQCRLCDAASLRARGWDHVTYGCFSTAPGGGEAHAARRGAHPPRAGHRRRHQRRPAPDARRRAVPLEGVRLRQRRPARRLRRHAGPARG